VLFGLKNVSGANSNVSSDEGEKARSRRSACVPAI